MPADDEKRKLRELKRAVKKRGNKARRARLKRDAAADPDADPPPPGAEFGRHSTKALNGLDRDATRKRDD